MPKIKVTLTRGFAQKTDRQIQCAKSLGLTRRGRSRVLEDTPAVRGLLARTSHMVTVEPVADDEAADAR